MVNHKNRTCAIRSHSWIVKVALRFQTIRIFYAFFKWQCKALKHNFLIMSDTFNGVGILGRICHYVCNPLSKHHFCLKINIGDQSIWKSIQESDTYQMTLKLAALFLQKSTNWHWAWSKYIKSKKGTTLKNHHFMICNFTFIPSRGSFTLMILEMYFAFCPALI